MFCFHNPLSDIILTLFCVFNCLFIFLFIYFFWKGGFDNTQEFDMCKSTSKDEY